MTVTPTDLGTYLGAGSEIDDSRATLLIDLSVQLCQSVVNPLPVGADAVVLDVAARAYTNPSNAHQQAAGPFSADFGAMGGGLWLTRANKATLRRLAGSGGAFTFDVMPPTAGQCLPWWDRNQWGLGEWDQPL